MVDIYKLKNATIGTGLRDITIEKVSQENIHVRMPPDVDTGLAPLRFIPTPIVLKILEAIELKKIDIQDISRKHRKENNLPHIFDALNINFDKYILGYDATIQKICEYLLSSNISNTHKKEIAISSPLPKPFLLLAGISGTGKTRFVRNQSEHNCLVTPVRPDWHEPSDILGYVSRLNAADKNTYVVTDVLCFVVRAWKAAFDSGVVFENECAIGEKGLLDAIAPFWLCLDEMNLAPVEQYFADYLSVLESRKWSWEGDNFNYCSLPMLSSGTISAVDQLSLRADLQLENSSYDELWNYFCENGITLPFNLIVAGTVNMDETTHGFSRKVIDRAITLDFGEFYPNSFDTFFDPMVVPKHFSYPRLSTIDNKDQLKDVAADADGSKTIAFLTAINVVLSDTPFELAYRALNELLLSVVCSNPKDDAELYAVWDDFLMTKVLPRIEGDADKLQKIADDKALSLLPELLNVIENQFDDMTKMRKDYFLEKTAGDDKAHFIPYRSPKKIERMQARLNSATFTSFWP